MLTLEQILSRCTEEGDCKLWTGALHSNGYARIDRKDAPSGYAHLCAWLLAKRRRSVPAGKRLSNACGHKHCCEPSHWKPESWSQINARVAAKHSAARKARITATMRARFGKLTPAIVEDVLTSKDSGAELGRRHGLSRSMVALVRTGRRGLGLVANSSVFAMEQRT